MPNMNVYAPINGDFPIDAQAYLKPINNGITQIKASAAFAQAFFDWLRSNYALPRVDAVIEALRQPISEGNQSSPNLRTIFVAEITADAMW